MKVAVIGAGFGGLAAAFRLAKNGVDVTVFEADDKPGGLAGGFKEKSWDWTIEKHYHHWFSSDWSVRNLANEVGHKVFFVRPTTSTFINGKIRQLDSPISLLTFPELGFIDRLRTGAALFYLKTTPYWKSLENITAKDFIERYMGKNSWNNLWKPLFAKKFSQYYDKIPAAWFWARIKKRSASLGYPEGGFLNFAQTLDNRIRQLGGETYYKQAVVSLGRVSEGLEVETHKGKFVYDRVIVTLPSPLFVKITRGLSPKYIKNLLSLKGIGAVNLMLSLKHTFLDDGVYWLNVNDENLPFVSVVEHTNFMDKKHYDGEHLLYIGNYLPHDHKYFHMDAKSLFKIFLPNLKKINPEFDETWVNNAYMFNAHFAQPIIPLNYSSVIPGFTTPIKGLFLCNIQQVYPWDRGTNYAVENGETVADMVLQSQ